jgi:DNA-binding transcriptional regulator YhcF (GntR family)
MTRREVCTATGMNHATAKSAFHRLANAGLIRKHSMTAQHITRWEVTP